MGYCDFLLWTTAISAVDYCDFLLWTVVICDQKILIFRTWLGLRTSTSDCVLTLGVRWIGIYDTEKEKSTVDFTNQSEGPRDLIR